MQRTVKALQSVEEAKFSLHITFEMLQKNLEVYIAYKFISYFLLSDNT